MITVIGNERPLFDNSQTDKEVVRLRRNHIIFFSGGKASFAAADYVKRMYPDDNILLYFTDTLWESPDLYRFINEASDKLQLPMLTHSCGLNPIQLMFEKKLVYNSMIGDCSKLLKMKVAADFLKKGRKPKIEKWRNKAYLRNQDFITDATLYFGIGFEELHRQDAIVENWKPFRVEMPLIDRYIDTKAVLRKHGIKQPILYDLGFSHNNCNGRCVKAGQGHYKHLREAMPDVFKEILEQEFHIQNYVSSFRYLKETKFDSHVPESFIQSQFDELDDAYRDYFYGRAPKPKLFIHPVMWIDTNRTSKHYSFMKRDGKPYQIRDLKKEIENDAQIDMFDIGGCGCFIQFYEPSSSETAGSV